MKREAWMTKWKIVYSGHAQKDAKKIATAGLVNLIGDTSHCQFLILTCPQFGINKDYKFRFKKLNTEMISICLYF